MHLEGPSPYRFLQQNTLKLAIFVYTNLGYLTLEGPGHETVDTRSTSGLPLGMTVQTSYVGGQWHQN